MDTLPSLMNQFQQEVNRLFDRSTSWTGNDVSKVSTNWIPAVDVKEEPDRFIIKADIPGVDPKEIRLHMENGMLTIQGERQQEKEEKGENYYRIERASGVFYRRFSLPDTADGEKINAKSKNGVLEIVIPKKQQSQARKVDIKVEG